MEGDSGSGPQGGGDTGNTGAGNPQTPGAMQRIINHMSANKIEATLWLTRMCTVIFSISFLLPFIGSSNSCYQRALISNAATSALRLHQRLPNFQLNRDFFGRLFLEDSAHYLFYSLIFITSYPVTMVLVPVFLFSLLHAQKYTQQVLNCVGPTSFPLVRKLLGKLDNNQVNMLRFIACTEIFLVPAIIFMMFTGQGSLLLPFIYYRFITLRYASRRNPYNRQLFYELRIASEQLAAHPSCPGFARNLIFKLVGLVSRLAPQPQPAQPAQ